MLRRTFMSLTMGTAMALSGAFAASAQAEELTIFWAEWDPANYLQELANIYTAETGVTVTVQTTPWPDFQTKTFAEFNAKGDAFEFEYLEPNRIGRNNEFQRNLERLGITMTERLVDFALYRRRLEDFDYDMITIVEGRFTIPTVGDLETLYSTKSAGEPGSNAYRGVKDKAADALLAAMGKATTYDALRDAARAFDRVIMWNFYQIPELYQAAEPASYWNKFGIPALLPKYYTFDVMISLDDRPWPLWTWWDKSLEGRAGASPSSAAPSAPAAK